MSGNNDLLVDEAKHQIEVAARMIRDAALTLEARGIETRLHAWGEKAGAGGYIRSQGHLTISFHPHGKIA